MSGILKQGYLQKQGGQRKNWKKRFFTFTEGSENPYRPPLMAYYETEKLGIALGTIDLSKCIRAEPVEYKKMHGGCSLCFEVEIPGRSYRMLTDSEQDLEEWLSLVRHHAKSLNSNLSATGSSSNLNPSARPSVSSLPNTIPKQPLPAPANEMLTDENGEPISHTHICRGYLKKLGGQVKNWKRRYFVLCGLTMTYYRDRGDEQLGIINLGECSGVGERHDPGLAYAFEVVTSKRTYVMQAEDANALTMWLSALQSILANSDRVRRETAPATMVKTRAEALTPSKTATSPSRISSTTFDSGILDSSAASPLRASTVSASSDVGKRTSRTLSMGSPFDDPSKARDKSSSRLSSKASNPFAADSSDEDSSSPRASALSPQSSVFLPSSPKKSDKEFAPQSAELSSSPKGSKPPSTSSPASVPSNPFAIPSASKTAVVPASSQDPKAPSPSATASSGNNDQPTETPAVRDGSQKSEVSNLHEDPEQELYGNVEVVRQHLLQHKDDTKGKKEEGAPSNPFASVASSFSGAPPTTSSSTPSSQKTSPYENVALQSAASQPSNASAKSAIPLSNPFLLSPSAPPAQTGNVAADSHGESSTPVVSSPFSSDKGAKPVNEEPEEEEDAIYGNVEIVRAHERRQPSPKAATPDTDLAVTTASIPVPSESNEQVAVSVSSAQQSEETSQESVNAKDASIAPSVESASEDSLSPPSHASPKVERAVENESAAREPSVPPLYENVEIAESKGSPVVERAAETKRTPSPLKRLSMDSSPSKASRTSEEGEEFFSADEDAP